MLRSIIAGCLLTLFASAAALAGGAPSETVVLINENSASSQRVGEHYIAARHIPPTNVCRVRCTTELTVSRADFVRDVVAPLRALLEQDVSLLDDSTLRDRARFIVLTQGMPIRADGPGGRVSTAEMLALLDTNVCGQDGARLPRIRNPYTSGVAPGKSADGAQLFLVTALISSTADEAIALVDRSVASDGSAPQNAHWIYQDAAGAAGVRNAQYDAARKELEESGHSTEHVGRGKDVVVDRKRVMGYMSGGSYSALTPGGVAQNEYLPGAISDMLQSFGAVPENFGPDGKGGKQFPVTHMVRAGITGVQGTVAEPYNIAFPPADLFTPYSQGFTLAETFHQKIPFRYWMNLVLGDPLCAPYARRPEITFADGVFRADGAASMRMFVDGTCVAEVDGDSVNIRAAELDQRNGSHMLLVEATGPGPAEPRGWTALPHDVTNPTCTPLRLPRQLLPGTPVHIALSRAPTNHSLVLTHGDETVAATCEVTPDGLRIDVDAALLAPLCGSTLDGRLTLDGEEHVFSLLVGPAHIAVEAAPSVIAGAALEVRVIAADGNGNPISGWTGTVELHGAKPPVRWARGSFADGTATLRFASPKAGAVALEVRLPGTSLTAALDVTVQASAAQHATTPLSRMPLGQVADMPILFQDRFGNTVAPDDVDEVEVSFPDDVHARGGGRVAIANGRGVLRDVVLTKPGRQRVVIRSGRKTWSQPQESVDVRADTIRAWLTTRACRGAEAAALFADDPSDGLDAHGGVAAGRLYRRLRDGDATVDLPATGSKDGDAAVAVAFVEALDDATVTLRLSAPARIRVLLDGEELFDGVPKQTNPRKAPEDVTEVTLSKGLHRVTAIVERKGRFSFRLALAQGKIPLAPTLRVVAGSDERTGGACVSGRALRPGDRPAAGARIEIRSESGETSTVTAAADGSWFVTDVPDGTVTVRMVEGPGLAEPIEKAVEVDGEHVTNVDLRITDATAPQVSVRNDARLVAGRTLRIVANIEDAGGIERAWLEVDGETLRGDVRRNPWTLLADVSDRSRGVLEVVVAAVDAAGNEGRSAPVTVELVDDVKGPTVTLRGLSRNGTLRRVTTVKATAKDPLGVADVAFLLDGAALGAPLTKEPYEIELDPAGLEGGRHELVCVARDHDGNRTEKRLTFRVK